jgi:hypothetical protein
LFTDLEKATPAGIPGGVAFDLCQNLERGFPLRQVIEKHFRFPGFFTASSRAFKNGTKIYCRRQSPIHFYT